MPATPGAEVLRSSWRDGAGTLGSCGPWTCRSSKCWLAAGEAVAGLRMLDGGGSSARPAAPAFRGRRPHCHPRREAGCVITTELTLGLEPGCTGSVAGMATPKHPDGRHTPSRRAPRAFPGNSFRCMISCRDAAETRSSLIGSVTRDGHWWFDGRTFPRVRGPNRPSGAPGSKPRLCRYR